MTLRTFFVSAAIAFSGAESVAESLSVSNSLPSFKIRHMPKYRINDVKRVDDGYLVAFYGGEFGGALRWYANDGSNSYTLQKGCFHYVWITDAEIFAISGGAIAGLRSWRIRRKGETKPWIAEQVNQLRSDPIYVSENDEKLIAECVFFYGELAVVQTVQIDPSGLVTSIKSKNVIITELGPMVRPLAALENGRARRFKLLGEPAAVTWSDW